MGDGATAKVDLTGIAELPVEDVYARLGSAPSGLDGETAAERRQRYGPNRIAEVRRRSKLRGFLANFTGLFATMLWVGSALAFVGGMPELGWAIAAVIVINAVFSFWQEYRAERATEALAQLIPKRARVVRESEIVEVDADEVVPGDVIVLEEGDYVCADARLVDAVDLRVNLSVLTGESTPVPRRSTPVAGADLHSVTDAMNLVFAGTSVSSGRGRAVVIATGMSTRFGSIAGLTQSIGEGMSPLQREMERVTRVVATFAVLLGVVFFGLGYGVAGLPLVEGFLFAVGIIVANVPEGLLPTLTLSLSMGVQRMAKRNALVKRLSAVETLGATTVICTDKTGTLTANEMTVRSVWVPDRRLDVTGVGYAPEGAVLDGGHPVTGDVARRCEALLRIGSLCTNARVLEPDAGHPAWRVVGDPTEGALVVAARKAGLAVSEETRRAPRIAEVAFDANRKRMSTVHRDSETGAVFAAVKGAPRELLRLCTSVLTEDGEAPLTPELAEAAVAANDAYAREGLRVLAVATRRLSGTPRAYSAEDVERDLMLLGLVAMMDPPRPEVAQAVALCKQAGVRIIMITGDYGLTAESIARRIGIVGGTGTRIIEGAELEGMSDEELSGVLAADGDVLFARVSPEHKMRVAQALSALGDVVAMTGDGVNDAPALKAADIGVAMGRSGTDVAREAADMVLTDDNFASIVAAIEEGRAVYDNIRRFVTYIFTSNVPEIVPFILFVLAGIPLPLTVIQILAIDLGTDLVPALALGVEPAEPGVMRRKPRSRTERLLSAKVLARAYLYLGPIQAAVCLGAYYYAYLSSGWRPGSPLPGSGPAYALATTMTFAAVVATQIGNGLAQRTTRESILSVGLTSNRLLLVGIATEVVLLAALVYVEPLAKVFGFVPLRPTDWLVLAAASPALLGADEARKWVVRRRERARAAYGGTHSADDGEGSRQ